MGYRATSGRRPTQTVTSRDASAAASAQQAVLPVLWTPPASRLPGSTPGLPHSVCTDENVLATCARSVYARYTLRVFPRVFLSSPALFLSLSLCLSVYLFTLRRRTKRFSASFLFELRIFARQIWQLIFQCEFRSIWVRICI